MIVTLKVFAILLKLTYNLNIINEFGVKKMNFENIKKEDKEIYDLIEKELHRQQKGIELIASENIVSKAVMEAMGSYLTNKYAEGYPGKRYYGGCYVVDEIEQIAIDRAKELFGAEHAKVHKQIWQYILQSLNQEIQFLEWI